MNTVLDTLRTAADAAASEDSGIVGPLIIGVFVGLAALATSAVFSRRNRKTVEAAAEEVEGGLVFIVAPAPPLPESLDALRAAFGEGPVTPALTRYSHPVITANGDGIEIRDKKGNHLVTLDRTEIVSIDARPATIKPKGTILARTWPSIWITARRGTAEATVALTPIVGAYTPLSAKDAEALAAELRRRVALEG